MPNVLNNSIRSGIIFDHSSVIAIPAFSGIIIQKALSHNREVTLFITKYSCFGDIYSIYNTLAKAQFIQLNIMNPIASARGVKSESRTISNETLYNYLEYCRSACLIHLVPRQDLIGKNMLRFQEKIYLTDHGIREAIYGNNFRDIVTVLENIVYMELLRRGYSVTVGKNKQLEVDFAAEKSGQKAYFQVAYLLADEKTGCRFCATAFSFNQ